MGKKMKIVFLSFYSGMVYRGVETYVHEVANRLVALGHNVIVYQNGSKLPGATYKTVSLGIPLAKPKEGYWGLLVNSLVQENAVRLFNKRVVRKLDPLTDVVVSTNQRFQAFICRFWTLRHRAKLVIHGQGGTGLDERIALWSFPDAFIPLSEHQKKWDKKRNPFVKVSEVIHNGVTLQEFRKGVKPIKLNLPGPVILCVAAFWPMKRIHLLIESVAKVGKISLLLVGKGELENELKKLGEKLLGKRFAIKSFPHHKMPSVYAACNLFSYPTVTWESFGIVLVEAMASGLPVVATDDPIRREIVGDAGLFVDPTDTNAYAKALEKALETNWGDKPRKQAEKFSWDKIAKQYEKLFLDLIK